MSQTLSIDANSLFSAKAFNEHLIDYLDKLNSHDTKEKLIDSITTDFIKLCNYYLTLGNQEYQKIEKSNPTLTNEVYLLHYAIPEHFKDTLLLHRDVLLQLEIASYKQLEDFADDNSIAQHFNESKELLSRVTNSCLSKVESERDKVFKSEKKRSSHLSKTKHRINPWEIYAKQFETIIKQIKKIESAKVLLLKTFKTFENIRSQSSTFLTETIDDNKALKSYMGEAIKRIKGLGDTSDIPDVINWVDTLLSKASKEKHFQEIYTELLDNKLKILGKVTFPASTQNGLLLSRTIDFNKSVKKWFDFEILPELMDLWENKSSNIAYFKHSLLNLKSSLVLEKNNNNLDAMTSQIQTLQNGFQTVSLNTENIGKIIEEIQNKFDHQFQASHIFSAPDFLEVSIQSSLTQFASEQGTLFTQVKNKIRSVFSNVNSKYEKSGLFKNQNKVERSINCINYRMFKENNAHYDTLFLNKTFIGDLFFSPRQDQEQIFKNAISQWQNGFNKAILITGDAMSGKSTFTQHIGQKYFNKNVVFLRPNDTITFEGRKFITTTNLKEALKNIKKGQASANSLLVIDDLELWNDKTNSLLMNVRGLLDFIASEADEILVTVTISDILKKHLDKRLHFSETFSSIINLNKASFNEIYQAVLVRHGAAHKTLVHQDLKPYTNDQIKAKVLKLARSLDFNLGEVLQAWTFGTTITEDNNVIYHDADITFKDFFNQEEVIILKHILLYKQLTEKLLKSFVGSRYDSHYKLSLKRLVNTKVLLRNNTGVLQLNPVIITDIKQLLTYRGIIK